MKIEFDSDVPLRSGMEDDPEQLKICMHPSHKPPSHIVIPKGKRYRHVCPGCGSTVVIKANNITL